MLLYLLAGLSLLLLLVCVVSFRAILKAVRLQEHDEKHRHYLEMALKENGHWEDYQRAFRRSWELWAQADDEPRAKIEAEAKAKVDAENRAARGKAIAAEAKSTPEAQAKIRERTAAKRAN